MGTNQQGSLHLSPTQPSLQHLPLQVTLLDMGPGGRVVLLLSKESFCSGLSFLYFSPSMRWDLPQAIRWSIPPPAPLHLASGIHKQVCTGIGPMMLPSKQLLPQSATRDCLLVWRIWRQRWCQGILEKHLQDIGVQAMHRWRCGHLKTGISLKILHIFAPMASVILGMENQGDR